MDKSYEDAVHGDMFINSLGNIFIVGENVSKGFYIWSGGGSEFPSRLVTEVRDDDYITSSVLCNESQECRYVGNLAKMLGAVDNIMKDRFEED